jgi:hypothetical protein
MGCQAAIEQCTFVGHLARYDGSVLVAYDGSMVLIEPKHPRREHLQRPVRVQCIHRADL